jgi:hypothetical protein
MDDLNQLAQSEAAEMRECREKACLCRYMDWQIIKSKDMERTAISSAGAHPAVSAVG